MNKKPGSLADGSGIKGRKIVITGAGGFIGGALVRYFRNKGVAQIRAVDKKPLPEWHHRVSGVESLCLDVSTEENAVKACEDAQEVYSLVADMGGMGFIEKFRIEEQYGLRRARAETESPLGPSATTTCSLLIQEGSQFANSSALRGESYPGPVAHPSQ